MTGLDTNILVRFLMADDPAQTSRARTLFQSFSSQSPGFISLVCLAELVWVLKSKYRQPKAEIVRWLEQFLTSPQIAFESSSVVEEAIQAYAGGRGQFADCLIERSGHIAGCRETVTFDVNASKSAGMRLL